MFSYTHTMMKKEATFRGDEYVYGIDDSDTFIDVYFFYKFSKWKEEGPCINYSADTS